MTWARRIEERREQRRQERERNIAILCRPLQGDAAETMARVKVARGEFHAAIPKHQYVRSEALMRAYRLIPCQNCGKDDGTVCGAHSNWGEHGKGKGIKADDNRCASLCFTCHGILDQGSILSHAERYAIWTIAHVKTVRELLARNLWPKGVSIPETQ